MNLREAMFKAGLASKEEISKVEAQKKEIEKAWPEAHAENEYRNRKKEWEAKERRDRLTTLAMLGEISKQLVASTHRTVKELLCSKCGAEGSTRIDVMAVHAQMLKERNNFLFLIDEEEGKRFAQELKDRIGVIIDSIEYTFAGEEKKGYLCIPCQKEILDNAPHS